MRKIRAEMRNIPDTVLKLIKTLGSTAHASRKLTNAEVVCYAVAKLTGVYTLQSDGSYIYVPRYEVCPDCSGLIEKDDFHNPPPNDEANIEVWRAIKRQHVTRCTWLAMAMAGKFSKTVEVKHNQSTEPHVIEMKHNNSDVPVKITAEPMTAEKTAEAVSEPVTVAEAVPDTPNTSEEAQKPTLDTTNFEGADNDKPSLDEQEFDGEKTEQYVDDFGAVKTRIVKQKSTVKRDASDEIPDLLTNPKYRDKDGTSVSMEMGDSNPDGTRKPAISPDQASHLRKGKTTFQGKVTEKDVDDKTMILKTKVEGEMPDVKPDTGSRVEKDPDLAEPKIVGKKRVAETNQPENKDVPLDDMTFEE